MGCQGCREWWRVGGDSHGRGRGVSHWASLRAHSRRTTYQWHRYIPWRWVWPPGHGTIEWRHIRSWRCGVVCHVCTGTRSQRRCCCHWCWAGAGLSEWARPKLQSCGMVRREEGELEMTHLEIIMKHICRVNHLECPQSLQMVNMD